MAECAYKIMLVDDEPEVLNSMLETIDWGKNGFGPPVGCYNGKEAIERIEEGFIPDVLITDINMPLVNGLELTQYVRRHYEDILVVILSGYDEFSYAQEAIKLQVYDYILKPVTPMQLQQLLVVLRSGMDDTEANDMNGAAKLGAMDFLNRLIEGAVAPEQAEEEMRRHQISFKGCCHIVALLDPDRQSSHSRGGKAQEYTNENLRNSLYDISAELLEHNTQILTVRDKKGRTYLIASDAIASGAAVIMKSALAQILRVFSERSGCTASAGVGHVAMSPQAICKSADEAAGALDDRFYYGGCNILNAGEYPIVTAEKFDFSSFERMFENAVQQLDDKGAFSVLTAMFERMKVVKLPIMQCAKNCQRLIVPFIRFASGIIGEKENVLLEEAWDQYDLYDVASLDEMRHMTQGFCEHVFEVMNMVCTDSSSAQIRKAESYIRQNFSNPKLSLRMVTNHIAVSTSYFSAQFKTRTGLTFVEYLTNVRMDKAKQLLSLTDWPTYEVAEAVGFANPHYFSVAFKRLTGMTPREYREQNPRIRDEHNVP
ncbi:MAG: response regulator [Clostridiales Family XIII bacterium]|jgi:two-component system response regulator YesN|nr:response regulator [Clostridiales Family XIII bacterium]